MSRIAKTLFACVVAAGFAGVAVAAPAPGSAKLTPAEKTALKQAISSCKSEAKGKKVPWLQRRKYVKGCVVEALKLYVAELAPLMGLVVTPDAPAYHCHVMSVREASWKTRVLVAPV